MLLCQYFFLSYCAKHTHTHTQTHTHTLTAPPISLKIKQVKITVRDSVTLTLKSTVSKTA